MNSLILIYAIASLTGKSGSGIEQRGRKKSPYKTSKTKIEVGSSVILLSNQITDLKWELCMNWEMCPLEDSYPQQNSADLMRFVTKINYRDSTSIRRTSHPFAREISPLERLPNVQYRNISLIFLESEMRYS